MAKPTIMDKVRGARVPVPSANGHHKPPVADVNLTDVGNGHRFAADHREAARFVVGWGWLCWDGRRWKRDDRHRVELLAKQTVAALRAEALAGLAAAAEAEKRAAIAAAEAGDVDPTKPGPVAEAVKKAAAAAKAKLAWATKSEDARRVTAMLQMARSELAEPAERFDAHPWLFNAANGTLDLRTGHLRPHERGDYLTQLSPASYRPGAKCPAWAKFLDAVFGGDKELIRFVQRWAGYCLTGDTRESILVMPFGDGANGKTTLIEVMLDVMGLDYGMKAPADILLARRHDPHPTERADLRGRRLVACVESDDGRRLAEGLMKELTGSDRVRARFMRMDFFEFAPTHKVVLATNHLPRVRGTDHAVWRRLAPVPFAVRFWNPDDKAAEGEVRDERLRADKELKAKLLAERDGILAWLVAGCLDWQKNGLPRPKAVLAAGRIYREDEDLIGKFVAERLTLDPAAATKAGPLYAAFRKWCEDAGESPPSATAFGRRMAGVAEKKKTGGVVVYAGIRVQCGEGG